jgi:hypothetical protein
MNDEQIVSVCDTNYTMLSPERRMQLVRSVEHVIQNDIPGDFVEIGVWRGGAIMIMLYKLLQLGVQDRHIHLYDTFSGTTEASVEDTCIDGRCATDPAVFETVKCEAEYDLVYKNIQSVGYPMDRIHFHIGDIRNVAVSDIPDIISLLRLDNDWYELYAFELPLFEPRVSYGGIVIIDDYGWWNGCKKAVDEYIGTMVELYHVQETAWWIRHPPAN